MHLVSFAPALVGAVLMAAGALEAQAAPTQNTATKTTSTRVATVKPSKTTVPVQRTAKSIDCSKQADAKGLHGSPRKHFMSSCKKD